MAPRVPRPLLLLWAAFCLLLLGFLLGTVQVRAGTWIGRRLSVARIWEYFLDFLRDQGASPAIIALVAAAAVVALLGSVGLVWLAFGLRDAGSETPTNDASVH